MNNYLGARLLWTHIDQFLRGISRNGTPGVADLRGMVEFFDLHHVRPADVAEALEVVGRGDAATVAEYVREHPELQSWYANAPKLTATPAG